AASLLGAWFIVEAARLSADPERAIFVFRASNVYLTLLFAAVAVDVLI
nr:protoheme IX farnesyltransferase [Actinomycetota bacterium]NIS33981.1 protoheme IX farnesyltransferase [Actinomycetota bacterium]NIU68787.1 protoheme IX farnesyltransferase [Actinomycetota bacterium]NIV88882.1 protoheme IX farnesyltransferase [Actinomycetota bacterium]NIW30639.1 protoheme IX farnesyltransferase [Actinomycetota bacterium]